MYEEPPADEKKMAEDSVRLCSNSVPKTNKKNQLYEDYKSTVQYAS